MPNKQNKPTKKSLRLTVFFLAIILPLVCLARGLYGSFLFSFPIVFLWQIGIEGKRPNSLGLIRPSLISIIAGISTGLILGLAGGILLKLLKITGYALTKLNSLKLGLGPLSFEFALQKEAGYEMLNNSNTALGLILYFFFCLFIIGLGEELFWRGFIQGKISGKLSDPKAVWLTAILFALAHFYIFRIVSFGKGLFFLILIGLSGAVWGYLMSCFKNIYSCAISHGIAAFIIWKYFFFAT
ncbi:MAG: CPBP family intramembrane metalloprotease [Candidatus Omnitrophica bacterium]|nr:CPBP family intramembrane metalloprotease [Candidatus Omnitrophota bacterium]